MSAQIEIREADLTESSDAEAIVRIVGSYAGEPAGGAQPLSETARKRLIPALQQHPTALILLASQTDTAIGVAVCFLGFSTFHAQPLLNLHDFAVLPEYRGQGVGQALLTAVENAAIDRGCCKVTLEVLDSNTRAMELYHRFGFANPSANCSTSTHFLAKTLAPTAADP